MWYVGKLEFYVDVECGDIGEVDDDYFESVGLVGDEFG